MSEDDWLAHLPAPARAGRGASLEQRVRAMEDRIAVEEHIYRWTYTHDAGLTEQKVALHADDCVIHHRAGDIVGIEAIRAFWEVGPPNAQIRHMRHRVSNLTVRFEKPHLARTLALYVWTQDVRLDEGTWVPATGGGWYADTLRRDDTDDLKSTGWLYVERAFLRSYDFALDGPKSFGGFHLGREAVPAADLDRLAADGVIHRERSA